MSGMTMPFTAAQGEMCQLSAGSYSVQNGLDAALTSARKRVTGELTFTPVPGQKVAAQTSVLTAVKKAVTSLSTSSSLSLANLQHFVPSGAAMRAADDKRTCYAVAC